MFAVATFAKRDKASRHKKYGLLQLLVILLSPWNCISMDFIISLTVSEGFDKIWSIVDRLPKMALFIPLKSGNQSPVLNCPRVVRKKPGDSCTPVRDSIK